MALTDGEIKELEMKAQATPVPQPRKRGWLRDEKL